MRNFVILALLAAAVLTNSCSKRTEEPPFLFLEFEKVAGPFYRVNKIEFANNQNGMLLVDTRSVYKTSDGGRSWNEVYTASGLLTEFDYPQVDTAYVFWQSGSSSDHNVVRSIDGGMTWNNVSMLSEDVISDFYSGGKGFAFSSIPPNSVSRFVRTTNAAGTWSNVTNNVGPSLLDFQFVSATKGFMVYSDLSITNDGGVTWSPTFSNPNGWSHMSADGTCYATNDAGIFRSTDFGATWTKCRSGYYWMVEFYGSTVVAVEFNQFMISKDNGLTWTQAVFEGLTSPSEVEIRNFCMVDEQHGIVIAEMAGYSSPTAFRFTIP